MKLGAYFYFVSAAILMNVTFFLWRIESLLSEIIKVLKDKKP